MYDTSGTQSICRPVLADYDIEARLNWLKAQLRRAEATSPSRRACVDVALLPTRPALTTGQAFARFGMLMGLFPPAAIFIRMFWGEITRHDFQFGWCLLVLTMNVVCCLVGRTMGGQLFSSHGAAANNSGRPTWATTLVASALLGFVWGLATGASGGVFFFGIGAFFGAACAVPVALVGFPVFAALHRLLTRDGMIEAARLWPLAFGIPAVIAALILSPFVVSY